MKRVQWVHRIGGDVCASEDILQEVPSHGICVEHDRRVDLVEVKPEEGVFTPITTLEGATFEMYTNGWAVGYKVTAPGKPTRYVLLNASGAQSSEDLDDTDVFLYLSDDPTDLDRAICFVEVWGWGDEE